MELTNEQKVTNGNQGAMAILSKLRWFVTYPRMVTWLLANGYTGTKLCDLYSRIHNENFFTMGTWILDKIATRELELSKKRPVIQETSGKKTRK